MVMNNPTKDKIMSKWETPTDWLVDKLGSGEFSASWVLDLLLPSINDDDIIQDIFQEFMDDDGYFDIDNRLYFGDIEND